MILQKLIWLELAEYVSIFFVFIGLILYLFNGQTFLLFCFIPLSLIFNTLNRLRLEKRTKIRIAAALNIQLRRFSAEIAQLKYKVQSQSQQQITIEKPQAPSVNSSQSEDEVINSLHTDLNNLNRSITSIINYLDIHNLENLEQKIQTIEQICQTPEARQKMALGDPQKVNLPAQTILNQPPPEYDINAPMKMSWQCVHIFNAHQESVTDLFITNDKQYLLSVSWDQDLKLWSLTEGEEIDSIKGSEQGLLAVTGCLDDYTDYGIATGSLDQDIQIWSLKKNKRNNWEFHSEHTLTQHSGSIHGLEIATNQKILVSGSYDQTVKQWDLRSGTLICSCYDETGSVNAIAVNEKRNFIASGGGDGMVTLWALGSEEKLGLLTGNLTSLESLAISNGGDMVVAGCSDGSIKVWYLPESIFNLFQEIEPSLEFMAHHGQVMNLVFSPDGNLLYTGGVDGLIKIWHSTTGKELGNLKISEDNRIFSLTVSQDGTLLAAGGVDGIIKVWEKTN